MPAAAHEPHAQTVAGRHGLALRGAGREGAEEAEAGQGLGGAFEEAPA